MSEGFVGIEGTLGLPAISALSFLNHRDWLLHPNGCTGGIAHGERRQNGFVAISRHVRVPFWMSHWQPKYIPRLPELASMKHPVALAFEGSRSGTYEVSRPPRDRFGIKALSGVVGLCSMVVLAWFASHYGFHNEEATSSLTIQHHVADDVPSRNNEELVIPSQEAHGLFASAPAVAPASHAITADAHERAADSRNESHVFDTNVRMAKKPVVEAAQPPHESHRLKKTGRPLVAQHGLDSPRHTGRSASNRTTVNEGHHKSVTAGSAEERRALRLDAHSDSGKKIQRAGDTPGVAWQAKPLNSTSAHLVDARATGWMEHMNQRKLTETPEEFLQ